MDDCDIKPPTMPPTIASLRAIQGRKRQLLQMTSLRPIARGARSNNTSSVTETKPVKKEQDDHDTLQVERVVKTEDVGELSLHNLPVQPNATPARVVRDVIGGSDSKDNAKMAMKVDGSATPTTATSLQKRKLGQARKRDITRQLGARANTALRKPYKKGPADELADAMVHSPHPWTVAAVCRLGKLAKEEQLREDAVINESKSGTGKAKDDIRVKKQRSEVQALGKGFHASKLRAKESVKPLRLGHNGGFGGLQGATGSPAAKVGLRTQNGTKNSKGHTPIAPVKETTSHLRKVETAREPNGGLYVFHGIAIRNPTTDTECSPVFPNDLDKGLRRISASTTGLSSSMSSSRIRTKPVIRYKTINEAPSRVKALTDSEQHHLLGAPKLKITMKKRAAKQSIEEVMAENLDPVLAAMQLLRSDLQQAALRDIKTQVVIPILTKLLQASKRRKLGESTSLQIDKRSSISIRSRMAPVAQMLPIISVLKPRPARTSTFSVSSFFTSVKKGSLSEATIPAAFSAKIHPTGAHLSPHPSIRIDTYRTIFKALKAAQLLDRQLNTLSNSQVRGPKGKWTCLFKKVRAEACSWPAEGAAGKYACRWCMSYRRPCILVFDGEMSILPLAPSLRKGCLSDERAFCVLEDEADIPKPSFFA